MVESINRNPTRRTYGTDPDTEAPVKVVGEFPGEPTGLYRQDGQLLVRPDDAQDKRRAGEEVAENIRAIAEAAAIQQELLSAVDRLTAALLPLKRETVIDMVSIPAPGANTNILKGGIVVRELSAGVKKLFVTVTLATASVLNYTRLRAQTTSTIGIFESVALNAGDGYGPIEIPVGPYDTINFQVETDGIITQLYIEAGF